MDMGTRSRSTLRCSSLAAAIARTSQAKWLGVSMPWAGSRISGRVARRRAVHGEKRSFVFTPIPGGGVGLTYTLWRESVSFTYYSRTIYCLVCTHFVDYYILDTTY